MSIIELLKDIFDDIASPDRLLLDRIISFLPLMAPIYYGLLFIVILIVTLIVLFMNNPYCAIILIILVILVIIGGLYWKLKTKRYFK